MVLTGNYETESNCEAEKKSVEHRQVEYLTKVIAGGGRL